MIAKPEQLHPQFDMKHWPRSLVGFINAKTAKGEKLGIRTGVLYLAPADVAAKKSVCPWATEGCKAACLYIAGRGRFNDIQLARIRKTRHYWERREEFMRRLDADLERHVAYSVKRGLRPAIRLNGTSDIRWENEGYLGHRNLMELYPEVQFYDYTKAPMVHRDLTLPNYHLTYSYSGEASSWVEAEKYLAAGHNVAVVFRNKEHSAAAQLFGWRGHQCIDGDEHDVRFLDKKGVVVALYAKGPAKKDTSGFVVDHWLLDSDFAGGE